MRFDLEPGLFEGERAEDKGALDLLQLFNEAMGRSAAGAVHHLIIDPNSPLLSEWLEHRGTNEHDFCCLALSAGAEAEARTPSRIRVIVAPDQAADWESSPPRIPLADALTLLRRPLCLLVEDDLSDSAFLSAAVPGPFRDAYSTFCIENRLKFENGGGLDNIKKRVQENKNDPIWRFRTFVVYDSDALAPGFPSKKSTALGAVCGTIVANHRLCRRAAENYLPLKAVESWISSELHGDEQRQKREVLDALQTAPTIFRYYFNMKRGIQGDCNRIAETADVTECSAIDSLMAQVKQDGQTPPRMLHKGFGRNVWNAFEKSIPEHWLDDDDQLNEMNRLFQHILERA